MNPKDLSCDAINSTPQDWQWNSLEYGEGWEFLEASECEDCDEIVVSGCAINESHRDLDYETECEGGCFCHEGPVMSYFYVLPKEEDYSEENAHKLAGLPLCLIRIGDDIVGLALTGGGMDLSWEICEAFMELGYLPPAHFARDLPCMAGMTLNERTVNILDACKRSLEIVSDRVGWALTKVDQVRQWIEGREKECTSS